MPGLHIRPPAHAARSLPLYYLFYAPFYILAVQMHRAHRHFRWRLRRYFRRLFHRICRTAVLLCSPPVLLVRGIRRGGQAGRLLIAKGLLRLTAMLCTAAVLAGVLQFRLENTYAYAVTYLGQVIGYVDAPHTLTAGVNRAEQLMQFFEMPDAPVLSRAVTRKDTVADDIGICDAIVACHGDALTQASGLFIDGNYMGAVENRAALDTLLESLRTARDNGTEAKPSAFVQKVIVTDGVYPKETVVTADTLQKKLHATQSDPAYYTVKNGDTLSSIAAACHLTLAELRQLNTAVSKSDLLHTGDRLIIRKSASLLQVRRYVQLTYTEKVPFETKIRQNANHYVGEKYISTKGVNGEQEVVAQVEYTDGVETARTILKTTVTKKPVTQKVQVGSKTGSRPGSYVSGDGKYTGSFTWPVPRYHTITSYFGRRWGTVHQGLDISGYNVYGKAVVAADGGRVYAVNSTSKWGTGMFSGYGYAVIIDHGNGLKTLYAHCSKVVVRAGQKVSKGQTIAYVGSTGYSTGAHLHFEVRVNNTRVNPLPYLQK